MKDGDPQETVSVLKDGLFKGKGAVVSGAGTGIANAASSPIAAASDRSHSAMAKKTGEG